MAMSGVPMRLSPYAQEDVFSMKAAIFLCRCCQQEGARASVALKVMKLKDWSATDLP